MVITVTRGRPTPEELAAVVALVQARAAALESGAGGPAPQRKGAWADPARTVPGRVPQPGPGAWRMSAWPA